MDLSKLTPASLLTLGITSCLWLGGGAQAANTDNQVGILQQSMQLCIKAASRPGFPYYDRPEADAPCQRTKGLLLQLGQEANRNRNLACSSRIASLEMNIWMIQFIGGLRMQSETNEAMRLLKKNCFNLNTR